MRSLFEMPAISVGELCRQIHRALRTQFPTQVRVLGEVSKCRQVSGNAYFSLKDRTGLINCICFESTVRQLQVKFPLDEGLAVEVAGIVDIWEPQSTYQLRVLDVVPLGKGALYLAFEQLKARLTAEGLFEEGRKRPIPSFIRHVAIVTSKNASVLADFVSTCRRRGAHVKVSVVHAPVQGAAAAPALVRAIARAGTLPVDVIVVARGGGSFEDLWAFNTEQVARAIAASPHPVITAIGHETDFTIADFVADKRAATATAAAEFVAAEREALLARISAGMGRLRRVALAVLVRRVQALDQLVVRLRRADPRKILSVQRERCEAAASRLPVLQRRRVHAARLRCDDAQRRLDMALALLVSARRARLGVGLAKLEALGPHQTLRRGYAIVYAEDGGVVTSAEQTKLGSTVGIDLRRGRLTATVTAKGMRDEQTTKAG
jgi:exodeoxyribonuclease VII large subunit